MVHQQVVLLVDHQVSQANNRVRNRVKDQQVLRRVSPHQHRAVLLVFALQVFQVDSHQVSHLGNLQVNRLGNRPGNLLDNLLGSLLSNRPASLLLLLPRILVVDRRLCHRHFPLVVHPQNLL